MLLTRILNVSDVVMPLLRERLSILHNTATVLIEVKLNILNVNTVNCIK